MLDTEKRELDRWMEWAGGEVNTWTGKDGVTRYEVRVRRDGTPFRIIDTDRYHALGLLKAGYEMKPPAASKSRCASCPQDAVAEFKVRCSDAEAAKYGVTLTGNWVDTAWDGSPIREETVGLCARCMVEEFRRLLRTATEDVAYWLKIVRAKP